MNRPGRSIPVAERAAAGAAFLDQYLPGWHERIDLSRLRLASECDCVLGQLRTAPSFGYRSPFSQMAAELDISEDVARFGFGFYTDEVGLYESPAWSELDAAWRALVTARREAAA